MGIFAITIAMLALGAVILARRSIKLWMNRQQSGNIEKQTGWRCRCGYSLEGLDVARCPECGRVRNFDATAEELGLTQDELARAQRRQQEREGKRP